MDSRKYVKFSYTLDNPCCRLDELELLPVSNDSVFSAIKFTDGFVTLYCKEDFVLQEGRSLEDVENYAENKLFAIFLEMVKTSNVQRFKFHIEESFVTDTKNLYMSCQFSMGMSCSVNVEIRRADGSIITEDENRQMLLESNKIKIEQLISASSGNMIIQDQNRQRFMRLFKVEDPVIRYFILYSWLSELLLRSGRENQDEVNAFIESSDTYTTIPDSFKHPPLRNGRDDKTYFTYLRNLMGHTVTETLAISDADIIEKVKTYTNWLLHILLEKLL
ncbi:MAG: hypothetical protein PHX61_09890 [Alphaproteobacteria bacterium]|nr:hypothetical protein [Alphaproteobacteria bacterium]